MHYLVEAIALILADRREDGLRGVPPARHIPHQMVVTPYLRNTRSADTIASCSASA